MNEFIEKLICRLKEKDDDCGCGKIDVWEAILIVNQLAEEHKGGWIPCSERLPDKDVWCLATFESGGIDIIQYLSSQKWWNGEMGDNRVIAWQPLPEPYRQKGGAE